MIDLSLIKQIILVGAKNSFGECECPPDYLHKLELPDSLDEMILLAEKISRNHRFLRVDFYDVQGHIYFGELTFFPASGFGKFNPEEWDLILGNWM